MCCWEGWWSWNQIRYVWQLPRECAFIEQCMCVCQVTVLIDSCVFVQATNNHMADVGGLISITLCDVEAPDAAGVSPNIQVVLCFISSVSGWTLSCQLTDQLPRGGWGVGGGGVDRGGSYTVYCICEDKKKRGCSSKQHKNKVPKTAFKMPTGCILKEDSQFNYPFTNWLFGYFPFPIAISTDVERWGLVVAKPLWELLLSIISAGWQRAL